MATSSTEENVDNFRVAVRCRPMDNTEAANGNKSIIAVDRTRGQITVTNPVSKTGRDPTRTYIFDLAYGIDSTQLEIYNETARPIVDAVLEGYNGTIFAYGQTGTGKTYTMTGEDKSRDPEKMGIIPNSFAHIFGHISKSEGETKFLVRVSYLEIYLEKVRDLLHKDPNSNLKVRVRPDIGVYAKGLTSFVVKSTNEMTKLMNFGRKNRAVGKTDMNEHSSRSHTIFTVAVEQSSLGPDNKQHVKMGKLHMVDLAGAERISKTGATGIRRDEAGIINKSLVNLGIVISALVDGKAKFVPYRNSLLTWLLQDSLGGNSKTLMIANIGPADYNCDETLNTLRYANSAKNIKNNARINEDPKDAMLREFQKEIEKLKKKLEEEGERGSSGEEEEGTESEDSQEGRAKGGKKKKKKKKGRLSLSLSPKEMTELKQQIEKERVKLRVDKNMVLGERNKAQAELEKKEEELKKAQGEQEQLEKKLKDLESKVIEGGVNLLEEAEEQERLLERSRKDLEKRKKKEEALREKLRLKEMERLNFEDKIVELQESKMGVTQVLKETWKKYQSTKDELRAVQEETEREKEGLLWELREMTKELELQTLVMDSYIPHEYQELIQQHTEWDEEVGEWHMHAIAYTGNSIVKRTEPPPIVQPFVQWDTLSVYLSYSGGQQEGQETFRLPRTQLRSKVKPRRGSNDATAGSGLRRTKRRYSKDTPGKADKSVTDSTDQVEYPTPRGLVSRQKHFA